MFRDKDVVAEPKELDKVKVEATVAEHLRGPKIKVFKYKPKKGYRRRAGPPLGADPARGDRGQDADPQARQAQRSRRKRESRPRRRRPTDGS